MKKILSYTRQQLLDNTIARYNLKNRADKGGGCFYQTTINGEKRNCAIGIEVRNPLRLEKLGELLWGTSVCSIFEYLPKRLQKMGLGYLERIQSLHDKSIYWDENGLSDVGKSEVESIKIDYNLR